MAVVYIPSLMRGLTGGRNQVQASGATVAQIVEALEKAFPGIKERLLEDGDLKPHISVAVDGEVSPLGLLEAVKEDSEVHFLPAISGGAEMTEIGGRTRLSSQGRICRRHWRYPAKPLWRPPLPAEGTGDHPVFPPRSGSSPGTSPMPPLAPGCPRPP
ncbi:MAG: MoaD/ThiS family protein [Chloroflexi bacterium]|nr:MoaD/ThiS family protein [Chloroflexota bacterium]